MTNIYLIRHAEAEGNLYRIAQGHVDGRLTSRGWEQVKALSRRFEGVPVDAVYASDLYRTCATASAIYLPRKLPLRKDPSLREVNLGDWEGKPWGEISRQDREQLINFSIRPHLWRASNGETAEEAQTRLQHAVCRIAANHDGETIAIVSHGFAIRMLLGKLQGYPLNQIGESPQEDNTAVSLLQFDGKDLTVIYRSDNSHLLNIPGGKKIARKRASVLEDGMYYRAPVLPEQKETLLKMSAAAWNEADGSRPAGIDLLKDAAERYTLFGFNERREPSALLQMGAPGWIRLLYVRPEERQQGLGVQLIGQAVQKTLEQGGRKIRILLRQENSAYALFAENDFIPVVRCVDGNIILEKDLSLDTDFRDD